MSSDTNQSTATVVEPAFFGRTYEEALELTQETRGYLAERGRADVRDLDTVATLAYSLESMRLTARLTQIMAWLLAMRAVQAGELERREIAEERWRLGGHEICLAEPPLDLADLPQALGDLLQRSEQLFKRISRLDRMFAEGPSL